MAAIQSSSLPLRTRGAIATILLCLLCCTVARAAVPPARQVLLIHAFGLSAGFRATFDAAFSEALRRDTPPIDLHTETLDVQRVWPADTRRALVDYIAAKYANRHLDALACVGDDALSVARDARARLGDPPVVAVTFEGDAMREPEGRITGIDATPAYGDTIDLALSLKPETRQVLVVDAAPYDRGDVSAEIQRQNRHRALSIVPLHNLALADVLARVRAAPDDSVVLFVRQRLQSAGRDIDGLEALSAISAASRVPLFSINETHIGQGATGGVVWQFDALARRTAAMARLAAFGVAATDIPHAVIDRRPIVDWRQLRRWNIREDLLPEGTLVLMRSTSPLEAYGGYVAGGLVLVILQLALIGALIYQLVS